MIGSTVVGAGRCLHPESGRDLMRVTVDHPYAQGGVTCGLTDIWAGQAVDPPHQMMPEPSFGEPIQWDGHHVVSRGVTYHKPEYDSATDDPLH